MKAMMFNDRCWINSYSMSHHPDILIKFCEEILKDSGFTVLSKIDHYFEPQGYTCVWLLSESHLAVHTFPEEEKVYIEMSSCIKEPFKKYLDILYMENRDVWYKNEIRNG
jgi:S-adenosylmethionine decarboxylase